MRIIHVGSRKKPNAGGNTHPVTAPDRLPPPKDGVRRVMVAQHATYSGTPARMPVSMPAWPEWWGDDDGGAR